jgi:hypothetical protein
MLAERKPIRQSFYIAQWWVLYDEIMGKMFGGLVVGW